MVSVVYKICPTPLWREAERAAVFFRLGRRPPGWLHPFFDGGASRRGRQEAFCRSTRSPSGTSRCRQARQPPQMGTVTRRRLFPHLYGDLDLAAVTRVEPLPLGPDGLHVFPALED